MPTGDSETPFIAKAGEILFVNIYLKFFFFFFSFLLFYTLLLLIPFFPFFLYTYRLLQFQRYHPLFHTIFLDFFIRILYLYFFKVQGKQEGKRT